MDPELCALIKRHVVQVDAHNRYLEKKRMWREYEEEQATRNKEDGREEPKDTTKTTGDCVTDCGGKLPHAYRNRREPRCSHGILAAENPHHSEAFESSTRGEATGESGRRVGKQPFVPSFDVHEADRVVTAREKQRRLLRCATAAGDGDAWLPDKFYTHELQQPQPWVNPTEVLSRYLTTSTQKSSDDELTPKASTSAESSGHDTENVKTLKDARRKKLKKKAKKTRSSAAKKRKKRMKAKA